MSSINSVGMTHIYDPNTFKSAAPAENKESSVPSDNIELGQGASDTEAAAKKKWTVLLYSAADNNLERALVSDVAELETVGSNENMNLVVQLDRGLRPSSLSGGWDGARRFYLNQDSDKSNINSPVLADMGQINMSDPKVLADFISWGIKSYPAENYMLVMSDHGASWTGALEDSSHHGWMTTPDIRNAMEMAQKETGEKIDIIGFDACLMASTEVAHELSGVADYMVASQNVEGGEGWPYAKIFTDKKMEEFQKALDTKFTISPQQVAEKMVNDSEGFPSIDTLSAIDLSKMKEVTESTDAFARVLMETSDSMADIRNIAKATKTFYGYKDQFDFADRLVKSPAIKDENLKTAAKDMMQAVKNAVIAEQHAPKHQGTHGLTLEITPNGENKKGYKDLQFAKDTQWDEALGVMGTNMSANEFSDVTAADESAPKLSLPLGKGLKVLAGTAAIGGVISLIGGGGILAGAIAGLAAGAVGGVAGSVLTLSTIANMLGAANQETPPQ